MPCTWFLERVSILDLMHVKWRIGGGRMEHVKHNWHWNNQSMHGMKSHFLFLSASVILGLMNFWDHSKLGNGGIVWWSPSQSIIDTWKRNFNTHLWYFYMSLQASWKKLGLMTLLPFLSLKLHSFQIKGHHPLWSRQNRVLGGSTLEIGVTNILHSMYRGSSFEIYIRPLVMNIRPSEPKSTKMMSAATSPSHGKLKSKI